MSLWLEFPPNRLAACASAYINQHVRGKGNPNDDEKIQVSPMVDPDGTRYAITAVWQGGTALTKANYDSVWSASRARFGV